MATACPILVDPSIDAWPRIFRWSRGNIKKVKGAQRFNISSSQHQLEMRSPESIIWQPYETSAYRDSDVILYAREISGLRMIFWDPLFKGFWYLGDRAIRQLTGRICIADNPPSSLCCASENDFQAAAAQNWPIANQYVRDVSQEEYNAYWKAVALGPILPPIARYVNVDLIGVGSVAPSTLRIPQAPAPTNDPHVYETQFSVGGSTHIQPPRQNWTVDVGLPEGASYTIDVPRPEFSTNAPPAQSLTQLEWRQSYVEAADNIRGLRHLILHETRQREDQLKARDDRIDELERRLARFTMPSRGFEEGGTSSSRPSVYRPHLAPPSDPVPTYEAQQGWGNLFGSDPYTGSHADLGADFEFGPGRQ